MPEAVSLAMALRVKDRVKADLFAIPGVYGVGVGEDDDGSYHLRVYVEGGVSSAAMSMSIDGVPVRRVFVGNPVAY